MNDVQEIVASVRSYDSAADTSEEIAALSRDRHRVAEHGRNPGIHLTRQGEEIALDRDLLGAEVDLHQLERDTRLASDDVGGKRAGAGREIELHKWVRFGK